MRSRFIFALSVVVWTARAPAAEPQTVDLWPEGMPEPKVATDAAEKVEVKGGISRRSNVSKPRLVVYEAPAANRTGAALIVIPGGGFGILADEHEGSEACVWLNKLGVTAFLLLHRCPTSKHADVSAGPVQDAQRALQIVRARAGDWKLDPKKIGVLGFSAGGQVALTAATNDLRFAGDDKTPHKPDLLVLAYPYRIFDDKTKKLRADVRPDAGLPPTFIAQCADDRGSLPQGSTLLFLELINRQIPAEIHIYQKGGHGYGMRAREGATGPTDWALRAADWLKLQGWAGK